MGCGCKKKSSKDGSKVIKSISEEQKLYQRRVAAAFKKVTNIRNIEKLKRTQKNHYEKRKNTLEYKNYMKEYEEKNKKQLTEYRKKYWARPEIIERVKKYRIEYNVSRFGITITK